MLVFLLFLFNPFRDNNLVLFLLFTPSLFCSRFLSQFLRLSFKHTFLSHPPPPNPGYFRFWLSGFSVVDVLIRFVFFIIVSYLFYILFFFLCLLLCFHIATNNSVCFRGVTICDPLNVCPAIREIVCSFLPTKALFQSLLCLSLLVVSFFSSVFPFKIPFFPSSTLLKQHSHFVSFALSLLPLLFCKLFVSLFVSKSFWN